MNKTLHAQGLRVTALLLEAVADAAKLRPALQAMTTMMDAELGVFAGGRRHDASAHSFLVSNGEDDWAGGREDVAFPGFADYRRECVRQPPGKLYRSVEIPGVAPERGDTDTTTACDDVLAERCMAHIDTGDDNVCYIGFARRCSNTPFDPERIRLVESLLPHLGQTCAMNRRFESMRAVSAAVMNRFEIYHVGVAMVDAHGALQYCNKAARRIFEQADGLRVDDGRIAALQPAETQELLRSVREHIHSDLPDGHFAPRLLRISRGQGGSPLSVAFSPYRGGSSPVMRCGSAGHAVMMIYNPDRPPVERTDVITQIHGLSTQESALACAIAAGESLEDIARENKRSLEAVRSQLKRVFRKTGTSRQTELVKLVLSGPAAMVQ